MAENQIDKVGWWHERLADWMLANPDKTLSEAAATFGRSLAWISVIKNSDSFKAHFAAKSSTLSTGIIDDLQAKTAAVAELALDEMGRRLERPSNIPFEDLVEGADKMLRRLGYGVDKSSPAAKVNVSVGLVTTETLDAARAKMRQLQMVTHTTVREARGSDEQQRHELLPSSGSASGEGSVILDGVAVEVSTGSDESSGGGT